jgi:hypothetical protein
VVELLEPVDRLDGAPLGQRVVAAAAAAALELAEVGDERPNCVRGGEFEAVIAQLRDRWW